MRFKLSHEQFFALIAGVVLCGSAGAYWYVYRYIATAQDELATSRAELADLVEKDRVQESLTSFLKKTEADRVELEGYLLVHDNPTPFLTLVEALGHEAGVMVEVEKLTEETSAVSQEKQDDKKEVSTKTPERYLRVVLSVQGSWKSVYHLLHLLEHMPYVVELDTVALEEQEGDGVSPWNGQVHMQVLVR